MTARDTLLRKCTLRVHVGASQKGSGFYVSSGRVVTCAHVIEAVRMGSAESSEVTVVDTAGGRYPVEILHLDLDNDVAVLKLHKPPDSHPCVLLDPEIATRDPLRTFGYTESYPHGEPVTLAAEGEMGDRPWIKLKEGQVVPGMSGSPLLNDRTGGVCGVLKRSRDPRQPLGGYAVSLQTVFDLDPELRRKNQEFHEKHPEWIGLLDVRRQQYWRSAWGGRVRSARTTKYFVVTLGPADKSLGWQARADVYPDNEQVGPVPIDLNAVRKEVARLFRDWASRGRVRTAQEQVRLLGTILFGAAFPPEIGERFGALAQGQHTDRVLVALRFDENTEDDFMNLPWEHLYREGQGRAEMGLHLAIERTLGFARTVHGEPFEYSEPTSEQLSVLAVSVKPRPTEGERDGFSPAQRIQEVVTGLEQTAKKIPGITLGEPLETPTELQLDEAVEGYDIIHYVGFGRFRDGVDTIALGGDKPSGLDYVSIERFAQSLRSGRPRLVVLELCQGEENAVPADFAVLAPTLLGLVPAVVAFQYPLPSTVAKSFNDVLYDLLASGASVDAAVQEARNKLRVEGRAFASPALWLKCPGDLRLTTGEATELTSSRPGATVSASRG